MRERARERDRDRQTDRQTERWGVTHTHTTAHERRKAIQKTPKQTQNVTANNLRHLENMWVFRRLWNTAEEYASLIVCFVRKSSEGEKEVGSGDCKWEKE